MWGGLLSETLMASRAGQQQGSRLGLPHSLPPRLCWPFPGSQAPACSSRLAPLPGWTVPHLSDAGVTASECAAGSWQPGVCAERPCCPGKHSGGGDPGVPGREAPGEDHGTASWARATLRAEPTDKPIRGPSGVRGSAQLRPAHASRLGWPHQAVGGGPLLPAPEGNWLNREARGAGPQPRRGQPRGSPP